MQGVPRDDPCGLWPLHGAGRNGLTKAPVVRVHMLGYKGRHKHLVRGTRLRSRAQRVGRPFYTTLTCRVGRTGGVLRFRRLAQPLLPRIQRAFRHDTVALCRSQGLVVPGKVPREAMWVREAPIEAMWVR